MTVLPTAKLDQLVARHAEIEAALSAGAEGEEYVRLGREFSDLSPVVEQVRALRGAEHDLEGAHELLAESAADPEMRSLAEAEVERLEDRIGELATAVRLALLLKDAMDERGVILEVRAGTGGDEADRKSVV